MKLIQLFMILGLALDLVSGNSIREHHIPEDLNGSNFTYQWPVKLYEFQTQHAQTLEMAFMDVAPAGTPNNKTAILLHGRNFCSATWNATAIILSEGGYRVILPDQIGFCKSSKPLKYQFSLAQLAQNTLGLLNTLDIEKVTIIGHSMGGMLATRFSLLYPGNVTETVLVNPLGLEDWIAKGVPYPRMDDEWATELGQNYTTIRAYEQSTYYVNTWSPSYDVWVNMLNNIYHGSEREAYTWNQAQVVDMVLTQPIFYEFPSLKTKTLLMVGDKDNTAIGKAWSPPDVQAVIGHYDVLGKEVAAVIPNGALVEFADLGHAPQIQDPGRFHGALMGWLGS
jgi:pimeloyl-ACP methyl ester carboxylesterase